MMKSNEDIEDNCIGIRAETPPFPIQLLTKKQSTDDCILKTWTLAQLHFMSTCTCI